MELERLVSGHDGVTWILSPEKTGKLNKMFQIINL